MDDAREIEPGAMDVRVPIRMTRQIGKAIAATSAAISAGRGGTRRTRQSEAVPSGTATAATATSERSAAPLRSGHIAEDAFHAQRQGAADPDRDRAGERDVGPHPRSDPTEPASAPQRRGEKQRVGGRDRFRGQADRDRQIDERAAQTPPAAEREREHEQGDGHAQQWGDQQARATSERGECRRCRAREPAGGTAPSERGERRKRDEQGSRPDQCRERLERERVLDRAAAIRSRGLFHSSGSFPYRSRFVVSVGARSVT